MEIIYLCASGASMPLTAHRAPAFWVNLIVLKKAAPALTTQEPGIDHLLQQYAGTILGVAKSLVQDPGNR